MNPLLPACALLALTTALPALDALDSPAVAQWYMPLRDRPQVRLTGAFGSEQSVAVRDQATSLGRSGGFAQVAGRVWKDDSSEAWVRTGAAQVRLDGDAQLPQSGALPEKLQDVRVGGFYRMTTSEGRIFGVDAEISSPADHPYASARLISVGGTAFSFIPTTGMDGWQLGLRYDRNSTFLPGVPLPMVAYQWFRPEDGLRINAGIPFVMADWRWVDDWSVGGSFFPVDRVQAAVTWAPGTPKAKLGPGGPWAVKAGGSISAESWLLSDLDDPKERLIFRTVRVFVSGEWRPFPGNSLRLTGGRILQRDVYITDSPTVRGTDRLSTDPAWYGSLALTTGY